MVGPLSMGAQAPSRPAEAALRLLLTLGALIAYRLGCFIPIQGLDQETFDRLTSSGRLPSERLSVFVLGVTPIFSALFCFELLKLIFPSLDEWEKRNPANQTDARRYILIFALVLAVFQANHLADALERIRGLVETPGVEFRLVVIASVVGATGLLAWLGETITRYGLGVGFWLLLLAPSAENFGRSVAASLYLSRLGGIAFASLLAELVFIVAALALVVFACEARRPRAGGATRSADDFAIVWTPLQSVAIAGLLFTFVPPMFGYTHVASRAAIPESPLSFLVLAALIVVIGWRRRQFDAGEPGEGRWPARWLAVIAVQLAVTLGAAWTSQWVTTPIALDGPMLFIVGATLVNLRHSLRSVLAEGETRPP